MHLKSRRTAVASRALNDVESISLRGWTLYYVEQARRQEGVQGGAHAPPF